MDFDTSENTVLAAGGILYRGNIKSTDLDGLEVCVIHRPRYDDWSWPKGKCEKNETIYHTAVREIAEETGENVALQSYLCNVSYPLLSEGLRAKALKKFTLENQLDRLNKSNKSARVLKHVYYWIARIIDDETAATRSISFGPTQVASVDEVDEIRWLSLQEARKLLTHEDDKKVADKFIKAISHGALDSSTLIMLRHGKAVGRKAWLGSEENRPLTPLGAAASYAVNADLACFAPTVLVSSPWKRCADTIASYSRNSGLPVSYDATQTEAACEAQPEMTRTRFFELLSELANNPQSSTVLCMHRPVIGELLDMIRDNKICITKAIEKELPSESPYMRTANAIVLSIVNKSHKNGEPTPQIIGVQKVNPLVY